MAPRAILFDLDGTLVASTAGEAEAIARALRRGLGLDLPDGERAALAGRSWRAIHAHLERALGPLAWGPPELEAATAAERLAVFAELGLPMQPGARAAIDRFAHLPLAIVTGSARAEAEQAIELCDLGRVVRALVLAGEGGVAAKPAPDGYLAAAARLGVAPADCLVVEDSVDGIAAGRAAGCAVVAVEAGNVGREDLSAAHRTIDTLERLTAELAAAVMADRRRTG